MDGVFCDKRGNNHANNTKDYRNFLLVLAISLPSNALSLCDANYLTACVDDLNSSDCLQKYHACGQYEAIINHFATEQMSDTLIAYYYQGVAFYGLFFASPSAKFEM
jgi:hypothetical protein